MPDVAAGRPLLPRAPTRVWRETKLSGGAPKKIGENIGGVAIAAGHRVRVNVERRGRAGVGQAGSEDRDRYASVEHLGRHEVTKIVRVAVA